MDEALNSRGILGRHEAREPLLDGGCLTADRVEGAKVQSKGGWRGAALAWCLVEYLRPYPPSLALLVSRLQANAPSIEDVPSGPLSNKVDERSSFLSSARRLHQSFPIIILKKKRNRKISLLLVAFYALLRSSVVVTILFYGEQFLEQEGWYFEEEVRRETTRNSRRLSYLIT